MASDRFVVLGLARPRASWFNDITRWATSAALPIEFIKCLSPEEARARLTSGRRWSALVLDANVPGADRDLIDVARSVAAAVIVVADPRTDRPWIDIGATAVLPSPFSSVELLSALAEHARPVARVTPHITLPNVMAPPPWRGQLVAVTGPGGTGASTVAAMLAQGFADDAANDRLVLLADMALDADQAVVHDVGDVMPGLPELIDAYRLGTPDPDEIRALTFDTGARRYELLLGLRRHRDWTTLRARAVLSAIDGLRRTYRVVVADVEPDLETESHTGSADIEDRNVLTLAAVDHADAVVVVGHPGPVGIHRMVRTIHDLVASGRPPQRILPIVNRGPRSHRVRAEMARTLAHLVGSAAPDLATPVTLPYRRKIEDAIHLGGRWPENHVRSLHRAVAAVMARPVDPPAGDRGRLEPVLPGELGHYVDIEEDTA